MTFDEIKNELEKIISALSSSGFSAIDTQTVEKLESLIALAGGLNMKEGKRLIENLVGTMKAAKDDASKAESCNVRLTALEFYVKKLSTAGNIEDL